MSVNAEVFKNPYEGMPKIMEGKTCLIMGVANKNSICWHIAMMAKATGAKVIITYQPSPALEKRATPLAQAIDAQVIPCDVSDDQSIQDCIAALKGMKIDSMVYGPAFANKDELSGKYLQMNRENFKQAMDISCYSMIAVANALKANLHSGSSVLGLTYYGSQKVIPCYDLMGMAKAALEANIRYMAYYLGHKNIRVNGLSAGPLPTLAASRGITGYTVLEDYYGKNSPMERNITYAEAAKSSIYLMSDLASGVTGEIHTVDTGFNIMGVKNPNTDNVDVSSYKKD